MFCKTFSIDCEDAYMASATTPMTLPFHLGSDENARGRALLQSAQSLLAKGRRAWSEDTLLDFLCEDLEAYKEAFEAHMQRCGPNEPTFREVLKLWESRVQQSMMRVREKLEQ